MPHVALVLVDSSEGVVEQDLSVADIARKSMSSTLVVLLKWDIAEVGIEDVRERLAGQGLFVKTGTPAELTALIQTETAKWAKVAKAANLKLE